MPMAFGHSDPLVSGHLSRRPFLKSPSSSPPSEPYRLGPSNSPPALSLGPSNYGDGMLSLAHSWTKDSAYVSRGDPHWIIINLYELPPSSKEDGKDDAYNATPSSSSVREFWMPPSIRRCQLQMPLAMLVQPGCSSHNLRPHHRLPMF